MRKYYPLRPIQRRLVDTHFNKARSTMMNIGGLYRLPPLIDIRRLEDAINEVLNTYDIFRCRFAFDPETCELCQTFDGEIAPVVVEEWTDEEFELITNYLTEPYDLIDKPLYRVYIFKTPSANYLYIDFYHAVMDGTSSAILFCHEVQMRYQGRTSRHEPVSYAEFVAQEAAIPPETLAEGHAYWQKMLANFDATKHLPPADKSNVAAWTKGNFECKLKGLTEEFFRNTKLNEHIYFLGAAMLTLAKITGSNESIINQIHNGRTTMHERRIIGLMLEQFPCAWDFREDISVGDFLQRLFGQMQTAMLYRKSLDVVYNGGLEDDCVSFMFQKLSFDNMFLDGKMLEVVYLPPNEISAVENALDIEVRTNETGIYGLFLEYDASRYSEAAMKTFAATMNKVVLDMRDTDGMLSAILS